MKKRTDSLEREIKSITLYPGSSKTNKQTKIARAQINRKIRNERKVTAITI